MTLPFNSFNAVIIGSKKGEDINVFVPRQCNEEIVRKVTFAMEIIFKVFRDVFKLTSRNRTVNFKKFSQRFTIGLCILSMI